MAPPLFKSGWDPLAEEDFATARSGGGWSKNYVTMAMSINKCIHYFIPYWSTFFFVFSLFKFVSAINSNGAYSERIPIMFLSSFSQDIWSLYWEGIKTSSFLWKNFFVVMPDWYDYDAEDEDCPEVINAISVADLDKFCPDSSIRIPNIKMFFYFKIFNFFLK